MSLDPTAENGVPPGRESDTSDTFPPASDTSALVRGGKALAGVLGIARSTLYEWFKLPGCPEKRDDGCFDIAAWRAFAQKIGSRTDAGQNEDKGELEKEELRVIIDGRKFNLAVKQGEYTRNDQIEAELAPLVQEAKALLRSKFENELPLLYSPDPAVQAQARRLNQLAVDEICDRLSDPLPCQGGMDDE